MSYSIDKWDSVINKYNKLSPIIYFKTDLNFLEASRRNSNFLQIKISDTESVYDSYNYIFATVDKSPVEGYYSMILETEFKNIPLKLGKFEINKSGYTAIGQRLALSSGDETTPSPLDHTKENEEAYKKVMNAVKVIAVVTILASAAVVSMQGAGTAAAAVTPSATTAASTSSNLPVAGVGFSAKSSSLGGSGAGYEHRPPVSIIDKTKEILIGVLIFLGVGYIISKVFGIKPNLNFAV